MVHLHQEEMVDQVLQIVFQDHQLLTQVEVEQVLQMVELQDQEDQVEEDQQEQLEIM
jgi:ABC-type lipoprotein export system ATPase subunit